MLIECKDCEVEVPQEWIDVWESLYWPDDVAVAIHKCMIWTACNPDRKTTKRGLRKRINVFMKDARIKPKIREWVQVSHDKPNVPRETIGSYLDKMKEAL